MLDISLQRRAALSSRRICAHGGGTLMSTVIIVMKRPIQALLGALPMLPTIPVSLGALLLRVAGFTRGDQDETGITTG